MQIQCNPVRKTKATQQKGVLHLFHCHLSKPLSRNPLPALHHITLPCHQLKQSPSLSKAKTSSPTTYHSSAWAQTTSAPVRTHVHARLPGDVHRLRALGIMRLGELLIPQHGDYLAFMLAHGARAQMIISMFFKPVVTVDWVSLFPAAASFTC